jgi:hypothetical protein
MILVISDFQVAMIIGMSNGAHKMCFTKRNKSQKSCKSLLSYILEKIKLWRHKKISGCGGLEEGKMNRRSTLDV